MKELIEFVRGKYGHRVGVVVATITPDNFIGIGWSKCCKRDNFDKSRGLLIARGRCIINSKINKPKDVATVHLRMIDRASRYFKSYRLFPSEY
jgi:hypothetical protein